MFRIDNSDQFKWTVTYQYVDATGKRIAAPFTAIYKRVPEDYVNGALSDKSKTVEQVVQEVFLGFEDVQNADGTPMESTAANIAKLLTLAGMVTALFSAFFDANSQVKAKN